MPDGSIRAPLTRPAGVSVASPVSVPRLDAAEPRIAAHGKAIPTSPIPEIQVAPCNNLPIDNL